MESKNSILDMSFGAIKERADLEMAKIVANIADPNTDAKKKRKLMIELTVSADDKRQNLVVDTLVKSKLEPVAPLRSSLYLTKDEENQPCAVEMTAQVPGQMNLYGEEQAKPNIIPLKAVK